MQTNIHQSRSFVLRIWFEPTATTGHEGEWRGSVTDVVSLKQRYFGDIRALSRFVAEELESIDESTSRGNRRHVQLAEESRHDAP